MAGLSSIERYVHAQKEQGKQIWATPAMHAVTFLFSDSAWFAWSSAAAARPAVVARVSRGLRSSVMAHLDRKRFPELLLACLAVAAFDSAAFERRYRQKRC